MRPLYLAAALALAALPALAQQPAPDPVQNFATTFENANTLIIGAANAWAGLYRAQKAELDKAKADLAAERAYWADYVKGLK